MSGFSLGRFRFVRHQFSFKESILNRPEPGWKKNNIHSWNGNVYYVSDFSGFEPHSRKYIFFYWNLILHWLFQMLKYINLSIWIKYITRHLKEKKWREKIHPWVGLEPTMYFRAEIQKYFARFLVQVKLAKSPFEINWPLEARAEITTKISLVFWSIWRHQKDISKATEPK